MNLSLYSAATGMEAQQLNLNTIANNLANVNTPGFKRSKIEFQDLLYQQPRAVGTDAGGGNLASGYARYGTRVSGPQVGAIAVMGRNGGGHVGVVTGIDPNGNPIVLSGNTWNRNTGGRHTVAEQVYPRGRISAYVMP